MMDGRRCNAVALTGNTYCHFHNRHYQRNTPADPDYQLPIFEDSRSILLGIRQLIDADLRSKLDPSQVTRLLYAYQIAASIVHRPDGLAPEALRALEEHQSALIAAKALTLAEASEKARNPAETEKQERSRRSMEEFMEDLENLVLEAEAKATTEAKNPQPNQGG